MKIILHVSLVKAGGGGEVMQYVIGNPGFTPNMDIEFGVAPLPESCQKPKAITFVPEGGYLSVSLGNHHCASQEELDTMVRGYKKNGWYRIGDEPSVFAFSTDLSPK